MTAVDREQTGSGLDKPDDLEAVIFHDARKAGVPTDRPFPFFLRGTAQNFKLHVVNKIDNAPHNPEEHARVKVPVVPEGGELDVVALVLAASTPSLRSTHREPPSIKGGEPGQSAYRAYSGVPMQ